MRTLGIGIAAAIALKTFALNPDTPIAKFIRRLICTECGIHSVRAYRELRDAG
jgi:hypothetical protein